VAWVEVLAFVVQNICCAYARYSGRADGVQFFELDHGTTQQDKVRRAPGPGPTYVESDLTTEVAAEALIARGFEASRPGLFVLEGVTMYLSEEVVRNQLCALARSSAVGSRIAVDFYPPPDAGTWRDRRQMGFQRLARAGSGEKLRLLVDRSEAVELVEASGWEVTEATSLREAAGVLVSPESGLPIEAVSEHKTLVAGVRS
jgi:methyltransferase (TIGR00027 family)